MIDEDDGAQGEESEGSHVAGTVDADVVSGEQLVESGASSIAGADSESDGGK